MDGQPEILSSGPRGRWPGWPGSGPRGTVAVLIVLVLACLAALGYAALQVGHRDSTIQQLRADLATTQQRQDLAAASPVLPAASGSTLSALPGSPDGSFSVVAAAIRPRPGAAQLTWLFVYGRHVTPGVTYSLLDGTCGGQYVAPADTAQGVANPQGDVTIIAPNLTIGPQDHAAWVLVYRAKDGVTLGGLRGPLVGGRSVPFRTTPPC